MTSDDITNYCEVKDCQVTFGSPELGFVTIDGTGVTGKYNNYRRFLALNELSGLPVPDHVLAGASTFRIQFETSSLEMNRAEFETELVRFQRLVES